ncbi:MAG: hypothetical protein ACJA1L_002925 [Paracoccaceae bacterium]|jgi:hypothetical protein
MDIIIHWGVFRRLPEEIGARGWVLLTAIALNGTVLAAFAAMKWRSGPLIALIGLVGLVGLVGMALAFLFVRVFLGRNRVTEGDHDHNRK